MADDQALPAQPAIHSATTSGEDDALTIPTVLDARQLKRIEAVHRGFLYQHLYAVGCLLRAAQCGVQIVKVERDEDIELSLTNEYLYVQVKTRSAPLMRDDIRSTLERFEALRAAHAEPSVRGALTKVSFCIVANIVPSPSLAADIAQPSWPDDVAVLSPGQPVHHHRCLPPPWTDIAEALAWCQSLAQSVPFLALSGEALVWKLAGSVMLASSGSPPRVDHAFSIAELPSLFEQLLVEIQQFPAVPEPYRPQVDEPSIYGPARVRLISGFSGAGKTSWASQAALYSAGNVVYFDVSNISGAAFHSALVRQVAARFVKGSGRIGSILLPGASGLDSLRLLDQEFRRTDTTVTVVVDNAHQAPVDELRAAVTATSVLRFVLLFQPGANLVKLESSLQLANEQLLGWSIDAIADELAHLGVTAEFATCQRLLDITGGLPLYVQSALHLALKQYDGNLSALCDALETNSNPAESAQESILSTLFSTLTGEEAAILAILSEVECPLKDAEARAIAEQVFNQSQPLFFRSVRSLTSVGAIQVLGGRRLRIHDALRVLARARLSEFGNDARRTLLLQLRDTLKASLLAERDLTRFAPFVRTLIATGDVDAVIDLSNDEMFHEMGLGPEFRLTLEDAAQGHGDPCQRFWALDSLAFADFQAGEFERIPGRLDEMKALLATHGFGYREQFALRSKCMLSDVRNEGRAALERAVRDLDALASDDAEALRIYKYNLACAAFSIGQLSVAMKLCGALVVEYYSQLGITPADIFRKNPDEIWPLIARTRPTVDDLKHLADCLDLDARCRIKMHEHPGLSRIHAFKFYTMVNAFRSAIKTGEEYVADCLEFLDPQAARQFIEATLLPAVYEVKLLGRVVPIRSQHALVLAHCGEFEAAEREMKRLAPFEDSLSGPDKVDLQARRQSILALRLESVRQPLDLAPPPLRKPGRNEACPCGSGLKFKRCHGR